MDHETAKKKTQKSISLALYYLLQEREYDDIGVNDICEKAKVSRMSFYRYYSKKDDILVAYCDERFEQFYKDYSTSEMKGLKSFVYKAFEYFDKYRNQLLALKKTGREEILALQFKNYASFVLYSYKSKYTEERKNNPYVAAFLSGGFFVVLMNWLERGHKETPEEMTQYIVDLFYKDNKEEKEK